MGEEMKIYRLFLLSITGIFLLVGQSDAEKAWVTTGNLFNGHMWQMLNDTQKSAHLTGVQEGILLCIAQIREDLLIPPDLMLQMENSGMFERRRLLFSAEGVDAIASGIDRFYRDIGNINIPIVEGYQYITLQLNYATAADLEKNLSNLRRKYRLSQ